MDFVMNGEDYQDMLGMRGGMGAGFLKRMARKTTNVVKDASHGVANVARTDVVKGIAKGAINAAGSYVGQSNLANRFLPSSVKSIINAVEANMPKSSAAAADVTTGTGLFKMPKMPRGAAKAVNAAGGLSTGAKVGIGAAALLGVGLLVKATKGKK
jgi:hypothetical protein